jgi:hypothetical protein
MTDAILAEVRNNRADLLNRFDGDLDKLGHWLQKKEQAASLQGRSIVQPDSTSPVDSTRSA